MRALKEGSYSVYAIEVYGAPLSSMSCGFDQCPSLSSFGDTKPISTSSTVWGTNRHSKASATDTRCSEGNRREAAPLLVSYWD